MHSGLNEITDVRVAVAPQSFGAGAINGVAIDTQGWDGVRFAVGIGAITGAGTMDVVVQRDANSNMTNAVNISGAVLTQVTNANPNSVAVVDVYRPSQRYVRLVMTQAANTVLGGAMATLYRRNGILPPTHTAIQTVEVREN